MSRVNHYECDVCGLCDTDLPDGFDAESFFERESGRTWCVVHLGADVDALFEDES